MWRAHTFFDPVTPSNGLATALPARSLFTGQRSLGFGPPAKLFVELTTSSEYEPESARNASCCRNKPTPNSLGGLLGEARCSYGVLRPCAGAQILGGRNACHET